MSRIIKLTHAARCMDCGAELNPAEMVRYHGRGQASCLDSCKFARAVVANRIDGFDRDDLGESPDY